ncbi:hypothetical protein [Candidatus Deianiraea vastatrix]|uniref:hypothetical protein n=1 Tax=Candidatus Deianiraea vastatrix TaxID=2163644 RepID=UPI0011BEF0E2|nr:hypothetical protein [Candidatus Deianiraea vastatrix]
MISLQLVAMIYQQKFESYIKGQVVKYNDELQKSGYNLSFSNIESKFKPFGVKMAIKDLVIKKSDDFYAKTRLINASCNIFSCMTGLLKIVPDVSIEFKMDKISKDVMLLSFQSPAVFIFKNNRSKTYIYSNMQKYNIINMTKMEKISFVKSSIFTFDKVNHSDDVKKFKILFNFESNDIFNIDYYFGNSKTLFFDTGLLAISLDVNGYFVDKKVHTPDLFNINFNKFNIKTSEFKIETNANLKTKGGWNSLEVNGNFDIYNFDNFIDYIGTMALNNVEVENILIVKKIIPKILNTTIPDLTNSSRNKNVKLKITSNPETKDIYINKKPLKLIIFDLISNV